MEHPRYVRLLLLNVFERPLGAGEQCCGALEVANDRRQFNIAAPSDRVRVVHNLITYKDEGKR